MHLLAATPGGVSDGSEAIDLGQSAGDIVVLSAADSELSGLADAYAEMVTPSLRLANLLNLGHNMSVDLYVESVISGARLVIVRLLGGRGYWPYGVEQIAAACFKAGTPLALLPGDDQPDAELASLSSLDPVACHRLWQYCVHGGPANMRQFINFAAGLLDEETQWLEPKPLLRAGLYKAGGDSVDLDHIRADWVEGQPTAALVFYRALVQGGNLKAVDAMITGLTKAGLNALPVFVASLKDPVAASMGVGASVGREGPAVHFGAALGGWLAQSLHLTRSVSRTLLGCGAAAAVAASFNAPIAGALFASEVVIGHYALSAFAPIVIASVTATAVSRYYFGDFPAFTIPEHIIQSLWEYPAFIGLGIVAGLTAMVLMKGIMTADTLAARLAVPVWLKPAIGGLLVGIIAIWIPHVLGVGYGATESAVMVAFPLGMLLAILVAKIVATAISIGFGFGGGVFSPALVIGAMLGGAYGTIFTQLFPAISTGIGAYTILGMGAVTAAVLGAPISTALIIFEMTGDYALTLALMVAVVIASLITREYHGGSFFSWQLERRGHDLRDGFEMALLRNISVKSVMSGVGELVTLGVGMPEIRQMLQKSDSGELFVIDDKGTLFGTITLADMSDFAFDPELDHLLTANDVARRHPPMLAGDDNLEMALKVMRDCGEYYIAIVENRDTNIFLGSIRQGRVMDVYNRTLVESQREERGWVNKD